MGWILPETYNALVHKEFYKKCVNARVKLGSFFYDGKLLRSPKIKDKQIIKTTKIMHEAYGGLLAHTATFSELWERNDGKKLLLLVNASAKKTSACIQGEIPDGIYLIDGCVQREITVQNGTFEAELPPHTVSYIIF